MTTHGKLLSAEELDELQKRAGPIRIHGIEPIENDGDADIIRSIIQHVRAMEKMLNREMAWADILAEQVGRWVYPIDDYDSEVERGKKLIEYHTALRAEQKGEK